MLRECEGRRGAERMPQQDSAAARNDTATLSKPDSHVEPELLNFAVAVEEDNLSATTRAQLPHGSQTSTIDQTPTESQNRTTQRYATTAAQVATAMEPAIRVINPSQTKTRNKDSSLTRCAVCGTMWSRPLSGSFSSTQLSVAGEGKGHSFSQSSLNILIKLQQHSKSADEDYIEWKWIHSHCVMHRNLPPTTGAGLSWITPEHNKEKEKENLGEVEEHDEDDQSQQALSTSEKGTEWPTNVRDKPEDKKSSELSSSKEIQIESIKVITQAMRAVDRLMVSVHEMFALLSVSTQGSSIPFTFSNARENLTGSGSQRTLPKKRKRRADETDGDEDLEGFGDDGSTQKPKSKISSEASQDDLRRLACPYFKRNPRKHHSARACSGPGWNKVHRMKEHLYREHAIPIHCPRCKLVFKKEQELSEHSRSDHICEAQKTSTIDGFTKDQEKQLRSRREMFRAASEEEKWKTVYLILFPDTGLGEIPCPYYKPGETEQEEDHSTLPIHQPDIVQFDAYLRRELAGTVRKQFESRIEPMSGLVEETLIGQVELTVRDCYEAASRSYFESLSVSREIQKEKDASTTAKLADCPDQDQANTMQIDFGHSDAFWPFTFFPNSLLNAWSDDIGGLAIDKCPTNMSDSAHCPGSHNSSHLQDIELWLDQDISALDGLSDPIPAQQWWSRD